MKGEILSCTHNDIYFLESNENNKDTSVTNIFVSNPDKQISKCKAKRKLKNKFHPTLEFFAGTENITCSKNGNDCRLPSDKCNHTKSAKMTSPMEKVANKASPRRNSIKMYEEAANMLGLSCSQTDNCRCIECQCHYFDYSEEIDFEEESDYLMDHASACAIQ